jgi:hypothetical protein
MLVYFHIDELARDAVVASALKKELEAVGGKLVYGNRLMTHHVLRHFNGFDAIILSSLAHFIDVFRDTENLPDNVFILQTEAIGQATGTLRRMFGKYFGDDPVKCEPWHKAVAGFLLWGHVHTNAFTGKYPHYLPKVKVVGHPRLGDACRKVASSAKPEKRKIGFVSRFNLLSPYDGRTPFESVINSMRFGKEVYPLFENSQDLDIEDLFFTEVIDFRIMYQIIATLDHERYEIHVRPHPRENRMGWMRLAEKLKLNMQVSQWDEPFGHWIQDLDVIVTPPSTSLYDVFFQGKKAIVINNVVPRRKEHILAESDDNNQILEATCRPTSVEEVIAIIESGDVPVDQDLVDQRLHEQVAVEIASHSIENILKAVKEMTPRNGNASGLKARLTVEVFIWVSAVLSHLRWVRGKLIGRVEQGALFDMTFKRMRWINRLTT